MTPLERYNAYKASKGLSETAATVTKPQSYNVRSGGVSARERATIDKIREQQAKTREANRIQQEKFWAITTAKKEDVPKIILSQPDAPNTSKGNMAQYFKERDIDPLRHPVKPDWLTPQKQTELREKLREKAKTPYQKLNTAQPETQQTTIARSEPRGAAQTVGRTAMPIFETENNIEPSAVKQEEIIEILESTPKGNLFPSTFDYLKIPIAIAAIGIVGFFIIRRMKK